MKSLSLELETGEVFFPQIDWADTTFRITYGRPLGSLIRSIQTIGLQNPPLLQKNGQGRFRIVAGFRRLRALQMIGLESIRCNLASAETEKRALFLWNFYDTIDRGFNPVEQSLAVKKLFEFVEEKELIREYLSCLKLAPKKEIVERYLKTAGISPLYQTALLQGRLFPETIASVDPDFFPLANLILALFISLHWGFQKQKEFLSDLKEISNRRLQDPESILFSSPVVEILHHFQWTPQQKGEALRKYFRTCLYPTLTDTEKAFAAVLSPLKLDHRTRISPPPFFEGGRYGLEITFSDSKELKESLEKITPALEEGKLDDLP
ncbi:MAG: ParB/RepB/Spo0J family partition protein [Pseudomonadota bacterium]